MKSIIKFLLLIVTVHLSAFADDGEFTLINGTPVEAGTWTQVVRIRSGGANCTATIVGPRTIITAAHCAKSGATATFKYKDRDYTSTVVRSPDYQKNEHDLAIAVTDKDIVGAEPMTVGGKAESGLAITLLGYGCIKVGGTGGNDGILRIGESVITRLTKLEMVSTKPEGAALCFGDSGGPAFLKEKSGFALIGINSKGNIKDTNYNTRLDIELSRKFLEKTASEKGVEICGINKDCGGEPPPPPPTKPTCTLTATPSAVKLGESIKLSLVSRGEVTAAILDGESISFPNGEKTIRPSKAGTFTSRASLVGPQGSGSCEATYIVSNDTPPPPDKPSCQIVAVPDTVRLGENVSLELAAKGRVTSATIDGTSVAIPFGKKLVQTTNVGRFSTTGRVEGPDGSAQCVANYEVVNEPPVPPETPNFAVVSSYCGDNTIPETGVSRVCVSVVKRDASLSGLILSRVLLVTYNDESREVLPIVHKNRLDSSGDIAKEELTLYANGAVPFKNYMVIDTRKATLTANLTPNGSVPLRLEGRSAKGRYFLVEKFSGQ